MHEVTASTAALGIEGDLEICVGQTDRDKTEPTLFLLSAGANSEHLANMWGKPTDVAPLVFLVILPSNPQVFQRSAARQAIGFAMDTYGAGSLLTLIEGNMKIEALPRH